MRFFVASLLRMTNRRLFCDSAHGKMKVDTEKVPTFIFCCRMENRKEVRRWGARKVFHTGDGAKKKK